MGYSKYESSRKVNPLSLGEKTTKLKNAEKFIATMRDFINSKYNTPIEFILSSNPVSILKNNGLEHQYMAIVETAPPYIKHECGDSKILTFFKRVFPEEYNKIPEDVICKKVLYELKNDSSDKAYKNNREETSYDSILFIQGKTRILCSALWNEIKTTGKSANNIDFC